MKDRAIQSLKGIAIIGVLFHHIHNRRIAEETSNTLSLVTAFLTWSVLLFIAISGWLHSRKDEKGGESLLRFIGNRSLRLLVPFVTLVFGYAVIWQALGRLGFAEVGVRLAPDFRGKIVDSLLLYHPDPVAGQLYFLPLLFIISAIVRVFISAAGVRGVIVCGGLGLAGGIVFAPGSANTGFSVGMLLFGLFCYSAGFLMHRFRSFRYRYVCVGGVAVVVVTALGIDGVAKVFPLVLLEVMHVLPLQKAGLLEMIGEASGTIYAYHIPFVLVPLLILVSRLPSGYQMAGVLAAIAVSIAACMTIFYGLRNTRLKWIVL
ncbi:MAG: acyltransferase family protein [Verrucomicrobia bacterium]|nr:acyltransferase family protein [Verrucomicrobiota bacterium]